MHKQTIILLSLLLSGLQSFSQERLIGESNGKPGIEIGYLHLYNNLNADNYFRFRYTFATNNGDASIGGFSLNLNIPTKLKYIDLSVGSVFMKGFDEIDFGNIYPVSVNAHDYIINGGGVYFGISPKLKGKFISLTSMFGAGFFPSRSTLAL